MGCGTRRLRAKAVAAAAWTLAATWAAPGRALASVYEITDLGTLGGSAGTANGVNNAGQVVGSATLANGQEHGFLWQNGVMTDLDTLGGTRSVANAINESGQIAGTARLASGEDRAFLWQDGLMTNLGTLGGNKSEGYGINASGEVVGIAWVASGAYHGFVSTNGAMTDMGGFGADSHRGRAINDLGQATGTAALPEAGAGARAFLWPSMIQLGTFGGLHSEGLAIDQSGHIAGRAMNAANEYRAFLWQGGSLINLGTLGTESQAYGINESGQVVGWSRLTTGGQRAFIWESGVMTDLNTLLPANSGWTLFLANDINDQGAIVGQGYKNGRVRAFLMKPARRPVLILPGIAGTFGSTLNLLDWSLVRGVGSSGLQLEPWAHSYDDLVQTLQNVGYVLGESLFVVKYDWRLPPGPGDGDIDGIIAGLSGASITDGELDYSVDYLGLALAEAASAWRARSGGAALPKVDVIAHSTGGLVARTYIQSAAYGGVDGLGHELPKIGKLIMIGVPNRGASKAWNPLHDNWGIAPAYGLLLSKILDKAYQKVLNGATVVGPVDITLGTILDPLGQPDPRMFIEQYVPTIRSLLATYEFLDCDQGPAIPDVPCGSGVTDVNDNAALRNSLVLDLNAGLDRVLVGDPNAFADQAEVTVIYSGDQLTPTSVAQRVGSAEGANSILPFTDVVFNDAQPGEVWYRDIKEPVSGDGTVPLLSSIGQFLGDLRVALEPFSGEHVGLMYAVPVQQRVLEILGASFTAANISQTRHGLGFESISAVFALDPVAGFLVDGQERLLGYSPDWGPQAQIPGSMWFGDTEGMGWVFGTPEGPFSLWLTGLGESYYVTASLVSGNASGGLVLSGFLDQGEQRLDPLPLFSGAGEATGLTLARAAGGQVSLAWDPSCVPTDTDYAIYEGDLGSFTSHQAAFCSSGGLTSMTFTPREGSAYFLVVPRNAAREGKYGMDSAGDERAQAANACLTQDLSACP
jgi:probable HAF family extracellular repeat protein